MKPDYLHFFIDPNRCIGCQACVQACTECDTHRGESMIHLEYVHRPESTQTVPVVCMHCDQPTCAEVCPADAIKRTADGVVQSARKPRCIALRQLRGGLPVRRAGGLRRPQDHDEVRHVLRPHERRQEADVRDGLSRARRCSSARARRSNSCGRCLSRSIRFQFGGQTITTQVQMMVPAAAHESARARRRHGRDGRKTAQPRRFR